MFKSKASLLSIIGILTICTTPIFSDLSASEEKEATTTAYTNECQLPEAFENTESMANAVADPAKFMQLVTLMSNPQAAQNLMNCSTDSAQWDTWMKNLSNPTFKMNAAAVFMNPSLYMNWMTAMSNPAYYQSMNKMMDPKWQQQSSAWMMNPNSYQQMFNSFIHGWTSCSRCINSVNLRKIFAGSIEMFLTPRI